jgi:hypothetical protein
MKVTPHHKPGTNSRQMILSAGEQQSWITIDPVSVKRLRAGRVGFESWEGQRRAHSRIGAGRGFI